MTPAQYEALVRREQAKQRQAINRYNSEVRQHNAKVKQAVDAEKRQARQAESERQRYNREVQAHNAKVRTERRRVQAEIDRLRRAQSATRYVVEQRSSLQLHTAYRQIEAESDGELWGAHGEKLVDMAGTETANSAAATNILLGAGSEAEMEATELTDELIVIEEDLDKRWRGALFSINENNPDAARHFCTSAREIIARIIDFKAPDDLVREELPNCNLTDDGRVVRREKIGFLLERSSVDYKALGDFIDTDVDDVVQLFRVFNDSTHGSAGTLDFNSLRALKGRVEGAIRFLSAVVKEA